MSFSVRLTREALEDLQRLEALPVEILSGHEVAISAIRHQREDDYH